MFNTGDLVPQQSGSASIGARQLGLHSFGPTLFPYAHVHMNSGVVHDPANGQSGVIRFGLHNDVSYVTGDGVFNERIGHIAGLQAGFEFSADGGETFPLIIGAAQLINLNESEGGGGEDFTAGDDEEGSFSEGGGNIMAHVGGGSGLIKTAIIRTQHDEFNDMYIYSSGHCTIVGSKDLHLLGFGGGMGGSANAISIESALSMDIRAERALAITTDQGNIEIIAGENSLNDPANPGDCVIYAYNLNNYLHFRTYTTPNAFSTGPSPHHALHVKNNGVDGAGPYLNGEWPIAHSGQVAEMILRAGGSAQSLQAAYDGGDEIFLDRNTSDQNVGFVVRERNGVAGFVLNQPAAQAHLNYGIAVSGGLGANGFALTKLIPNGIYIKSSGLAASPESFFALGYLPNNSTAAFIAANHDLSFFAFRNITYIAGTANQPGGQINLSAFIGSGEIEYRNGPYTAWHVKARNNLLANGGGPYGDGFHPIANSGQVEMMVLRAPKTKNITIESPTVNKDLTIWYTKQPITITEVESVVRGAFDASGQFAIRHASNRSSFGTELTSQAITCTNRTTGQITTSFAAPNIPANSWVWIGVSGVSGVATSQLHVTLQYQ